MALDKAALLAILEPKIFEKDIKDIGTVRLRELSAPEVSDIREACRSDDKKGDFGFRLVMAAVVDDAGDPMFSAEDLDVLRNRAQSRMGDLVSAVMEVNGFQVKEDSLKN